MKNKYAFSILFGVLLVGSLLGGTPVYPADPPLLNGQGNFGVDVETEAYSRDIKLDAASDRLRVSRQGFQFSYGVYKLIDLFVNFGVGNIDFEDGDLDSKTRPYGGAGLRVVGATQKGYFAGLSYQLLKGETNKFQLQDTVVSVKDEWTEQNIALFAGTKDLIGGPVQGGRVYAGLRFSSRTDDLTFEDGTGDKGKEDSSLGGYLGFEFSDSDIFKAQVELGTGDRNSIFASLGLVF